MSQISLTLNEVSQTFDLEEIFGVDPSLRPEIGLSFGQDVIDLIIDRTESGRDINGSGFTEYSKEYKDSRAFKAFRKDGTVDMTLTGSMLGDLDIIEFDGRFLKVGFSDDTEIKKAYNHNFGDTVPVRKFFGLNEREIQSLGSRYSSDIQELLSQQEQAVNLVDLLGLNDDFSLPTFRTSTQVRSLLDVLDMD